jgi:hypothetical protein
MVGKDTAATPGRDGLACIARGARRMILHQVKCEMCSNFVGIGTLANLWDFPLTQEWLTVFKGRVGQHLLMNFCSEMCLKIWLANLASKNEEQLSQGQKNLVERERVRIENYCIDLAKHFEQEHPGLKLSWGFTLDVAQREEPST